MVRWLRSQHHGIQAAITPALWLSPNMPCTVWVWPRVSGSVSWLLQNTVYVYSATGAWSTNRRHWSRCQLGAGGPGFRLSLLIGLILTVFRWRADVILGLTLAHGAVDLGAFLLVPEIDLHALGQPMIESPLLLILGYVLLVGLLLALWLSFSRWMASLEPVTRAQTYPAEVIS